MNVAIPVYHLYKSQELQKIVRGILNDADIPVELFQKSKKEEFEKKVEVAAPAIIICDADSNNSSSTQLLQHIQTLVQGVPVIITCENVTTELCTQLIEAGACDVLDKTRLYLLPHIMKRELQKNNSLPINSDSETKLLETIVEKSLNEIFLIDPDSKRFTFANQTFLENMGYNIAELRNLTFDDSVATHHQSIISDMTEAFWKGEINKMTFQKDSLSKDGSYYPVQIKLERLLFGDKNLVLGICFDISHRKRDIDLLNQQKQITRKLRLSNKHKSEFFANLTHEMRTTLNSVQLISQILKENRGNNLKQEQLEYAQTIHNSTNSLLALLNQVLSRSKIESGRMSFNLEYLEIDNFCKELERLFQLVAREKGVSFKFINNLEDEVRFLTDSIRLEQVLKNLISNALKFTKEGYVHLKVFRPGQKYQHKLQEVDIDDAVAFEVTDTGIGISKQKQEQIFEHYVQADGANTESTYGGTGLGLSISRDIANKLGGILFLNSKEGKGSTFTLILPTDSSNAIRKYVMDNRDKTELHDPKEFKNGNKELLVNEPTIKKKPAQQKIKGTVLLVDDSETHNRALKDFLDFKIEKCITAESAKQAYQTLETIKVDSIILDMYLPDADGKDVLNHLKQSEKTQNIPVIIYSGKSLSSAEEEELKQKADAVIQKNVMSYKVLVERISELLSVENPSD